MKILITSLGDHPCQGGVDTYINLLMRGMKLRGHDVDLLCYSHVRLLPAFIQDEISTYTQKMKKLNKENKLDQKMIFDIQQYAHQLLYTHIDISKYDLIHSQNPITSYIIKRLYPSKPLVATIHGCFYRESINDKWVENAREAEKFRIYDTLGIYSPDKVITTAKNLDEELPFIPLNKHETVYNAIDTDVFKPIEKTVGKKSIDIATSGVFVYRKGYDILISALIKLKSKNLNYRLSMYGDGPEIGSIKRTCEKFDLPIIFKGNVKREQLARELPLYDIFVQPSRSEPFGLSVTEAMSTGLVPICSNVGGLTEQVFHMENGLIFENENVNDLAGKIEYLIQNQEVLSELRTAAIRTSRERFSLNIMIMQLETIYKEAVDNKKNSEVLL